MQQELFEVLARAKSLEELRLIEPKAQEIRKKYFEGLEDADSESWPFVAGRAD